ncbi:MAG TPA: hypothetical protein VMP03_10990 [Methylomirabilota bacterium]|nr:hypothetical protein [Methylomirabilota bacterium]
MHPGDRPSPLFEDEADGVESRCIAGRGSDILAVVFSQVRVPAGHFGLSRLFARTRHSLLFLNQPSAQWYRGGEAAIDAAVERARSMTSAGRVVFYGSSMGGFGALATARRWPDADAVAYAPDHTIGEPCAQSTDAGLSPAVGEPTLTDLLAAPRVGSADVVIGLFAPYDAGVAARIQGAAAPSIRIVQVASGHEVHDHLYTVNVVRRIIGGFTRDVAAAVAERDLIHPPVAAAALAAFAGLDAARRAGGRVDPEAVRALGLVGNPGVALLEAAAREAAGDLDGAAIVLGDLARTIAASATLSTLPKRMLKRVPLRRMAVLAALGRVQDLETVRTEAAAAFPTDARFASDGILAGGIGQHV